MVQGGTSKIHARSSGHWKEKGGFVPLFDRLSDDDPTQKEERHPFKVYSQEEVQESVIREIDRLLNTRVKLAKDVYFNLMQNENAQGFPTLYGLPDFSYFDATNQATWSEYATLMEQAIARYEPRLKNPRVALDQFENNRQTLRAHINGDILINEMVASFSFAVVIKGDRTAS